jgi:hypothetical protein
MEMTATGRPGATKTEQKEYVDTKTSELVRSLPKMIRTTESQLGLLSLAFMVLGSKSEKAITPEENSQAKACCAQLASATRAALTDLEETLKDWA